MFQVSILMLSYMVNNVIFMSLWFQQIPIFGTEHRLDTRWLNPWFFAAQIQIPIRNKYLEFGYRGLVFCRNNGQLMENIDMGLTVPKWVLINWPKVPQMPQNSSAQIVCPSLKVWYFDEKRLWYVVLRKYKASSRIFPSVICRQLWSTVLYYWELRAVSTKGAFNNYVDKMKGEGGWKMSFCPRSCWMPPNRNFAYEVFPNFKEWGIPCRNN